MPRGFTAMIGIGRRAARRGLAVARCGAGLGVALVAATAGAEDLALPLGVRTAVCFPPGAPVFGDAIADDAAAVQGQFAWTPPATLADYVNEHFYPPLSTRMVHRTLSGKMEARLEAYRAARSALLNELADRMLVLHGADAELREAALKTFAEEQTPRILALEREADELRRDLIDGGLLFSSVDWNRSRRWAIGVTSFGGEQAEREAEFQVVRAAAFYEDGFGAEQRGLLLELAAELRVRARAARPIPERRTDDPAAMFFSPALARLRLPKHAPPAVVARIARFNGEKSELKRELRDAVFGQDKATREERTKAFDALTQRQWPRLVELEKLAEEIRRELATLPAPPLRAPPLIPESLLKRIEAYHRDRRKFIEDFEQTIRAASTMVPRPSGDLSTPEARARARRQMAEEWVTLRARVAKAFQEASRERFEDMRQRYEAIQADLKLVATGQIDPETGKPFTGETLLRGYSTAMERFDTFGREEVIYRGYRLAMLMPGLSAAQRRLLFGAAMVGLAQPLPAGESMPTGSQPVPRS